MHAKRKVVQETHQLLPTARDLVRERLDPMQAPLHFVHMARDLAQEALAVMRSALDPLHRRRVLEQACMELVQTSHELAQARLSNRKPGPGRTPKHQRPFPGKTAPLLRSPAR